MSVVTTTILSDGKPMTPEYEVMSIDVSKELNRIPQARVVLLDGDAAKQEFAISNTPFFEPGRPVEIKLRYEGAPDTTVFKGVIVRHGVEASGRGSTLTVELKDAAVKLTHPRKSTVFRQQSDHEIIGKLLGDAGLKRGKVEPTQPKHAEIVQYHATDWDFMLSRADVQGLVVFVDDGRVSLQKMEVSGRPKHTFEYGISEIYNFEIEADASRQFSGVESVAWDVKTQKLTKANQAKDVNPGPGNLKGAQLAKAIGFDTCTLSHPATLDPAELEAWAAARMSRSRFAMIRGRISVPGFGDVKPLDVMEIDGIGKRFNGTTLVTGVRHRVGADDWQTDVQFGLSPDWFCRQPEIEEAPAAGLLPAVSGLHIGVVDAFEEDPDKELRVRVILPGIDERKGAVWARLATPDAGKQRGFFFRPETGDEVVVGFFNNDPRQAVILGALFGSKNTPPESLPPPSADNVQKGLFSRAGSAIGFVDDKKPAVFIQTPAGNKIRCDDDQQKIEITDQHGNSITLDKNGVVIKSVKDIQIEASGNVEIKGAKVDVK